jgi:hypothetical protein
MKCFYPVFHFFKSLCLLKVAQDNFVVDLGLVEDTSQFRNGAGLAVSQSDTCHVTPVSQFHCLSFPNHKAQPQRMRGVQHFFYGTQEIIQQSFKLAPVRMSV